MATEIATATTTSPCKCCGLQIAGYYCRSLLGGGRFMGFREYQGYESTPTRYYRRGFAEGSISADIGANTWSFQATATSAFFQLCRPASALGSWREVDDPGITTVCHPGCEPGYNYTADNAFYKPGSVSNALGTGGLDTDGLGALVTGNTSNSITYETLIYNGFPQVTTGTLIGRLTLECTMDDAFKNSECHGLPVNEEGEQCRAFTTLLNDNVFDSAYQKVEGQSCVVFLTVVNATAGSSISIEGTLEERNLSTGVLISTLTVTLNLTAPNSAFNVRLDIPTPAVNRQITFLGATIQKGGPGGSVTYEPEDNAYRVDD